jgi:purine-binding chemotaxis protein CheW
VTVTVGRAPREPIDFAALLRRLDEAEARLHQESREAEVRREAMQAKSIPPDDAGGIVEPGRVAVLVFTLGEARCAVPVEAVSQVVEAHGLQPLMAAPPWLLGAVAARGRVVPVFDLRQLLGLSGGLADLTRVVVLEQAGECCGIAVEGLEERLELPGGALQPDAAPWAARTADGLRVLDVAWALAPAGEG